MSRPDRPVKAAEYDLTSLGPGEEPSGRALVAAAADAGVDRVVVHARSTADGWAVVHRGANVRIGGGEDRPLDDLALSEARKARTADGRVATLEETMLAAHKRDIGLVIRIHDTLVTDALTGALGIMAGEGPSALRARYLVIVPDARIGKRLRMGSPDLPSARALPAEGGGWRGALARKLPNLARAAADADDLVVPAALASPEQVRDKLVPVLRRRGAFVWVEGVPPQDFDTYAETGAGGMLVDLPWRR
jgi:glycerophosphoryl diester phosphodiesterase